MPVNKQVTVLAAWIRERRSVLKGKLEGRPKPWTSDPILQRYRFCNVEREDDTVTQWVARNWREPNSDHPELWFAMSVARWINWPETLAEIGFPLPWDMKRAKYAISVLKSRGASGKKVWTGAYMIGTQGNAVDKPLFIINNVLHRAWQEREFVRPLQGDTLEAFAGRLMEQYAFKGFMAGQVVADLKYAEGSPLHSAPDWHTWAASGPGSRRGLNRVCGRDKDARWYEGTWHESLLTLQLRLESEHRTRLHAQDLQNCLCEFDKYERVRLGEGRPRSTYPGEHEGNLSLEL